MNMKEKEENIKKEYTLIFGIFKYKIFTLYF